MMRNLGIIGATAIAAIVAFSASAIAARPFLPPAGFRSDGDAAVGLVRWNPRAFRGNVSVNRGGNNVSVARNTNVNVGGGHWNGPGWGGVAVGAAVGVGVGAAAATAAHASSYPAPYPYGYAAPYSYPYPYPY